MYPTVVIGYCTIFIAIYYWYMIFDMAVWPCNIRMGWDTAHVHLWKPSWLISNLVHANWRTGLCGFCACERWSMWPSVMAVKPYNVRVDLSCVNYFSFETLRHAVLIFGICETLVKYVEQPWNLWSICDICENCDMRFQMYIMDSNCEIYIQHLRYVVHFCHL